MKIHYGKMRKITKLEKRKAKNKKKHVMYRMLETLERGSVVARYMNMMMSVCIHVSLSSVLITYLILLYNLNFLYLVIYRIENCENKYFINRWKSKNNIKDSKVLDFGQKRCLVEYYKASRANKNKLVLTSTILYLVEDRN